MFVRFIHSLFLDFCGLDIGGHFNHQGIQQGILKLDLIKSNSTDEVSRIRNARTRADKRFIGNIAEVWGSEITLNNHIAIFYKTVGDSLHHVKSLSQIKDTVSLEYVMKKVCSELLAVWNLNSISTYIDSPQKLLRQWLDYRIDPKTSNITEFLEDACHINPETPGFAINGRIFPNPYYYAQNKQMSRRVAINAEVGNLHGDLNVRNVLTKFDRAGNISTYYLIDFSHYMGRRPLAFDNLYLELSFLFQLIEDEKLSLQDWIILISQLSKSTFLDSSSLPTYLDGPSQVVNSMRNAYDEWIQADTSRKSRYDELWGQYILAAVAVGLNYCNKKSISNVEKWASIIYSAAHLAYFFELNDLPLPEQAEVLQLKEVQETTSTGEDWNAFLDSCNHFSGDYLYALIIDPIEQPDTIYASLGKVKWSIVIDFDPCLRNNLYSIVQPELRTESSLHLVTRNSELSYSFNLRRSTYWYAARGLIGQDDLTPEDTSYRQWQRMYSRSIGNFLNEISRHSRDIPLRCIVVSTDPKFTLKVCELFDQEFADRLEFLFLSQKKNELKDIVSEFAGKSFQLTLRQLAEGIRNTLKSRHDHSNRIEIPSQATPEIPYVELERAKVNWLEEELTIVYNGIGADEELHQDSTHSFLRGSTISWVGLRLDLDIRRTQTDKLRKIVEVDLQSRNASRIILYHKPGLGGTTVSRRLAWDFHRDYPVILLNQYTKDITIGRIEDIYHTTQRAVLLVVDRHSGITGEQLSILFDEIKKRNLPIIMLIVARQFGTKEARSDSGRRVNLNSHLDPDETSRFYHTYVAEAPLRNKELSLLQSEDESLDLRTPFYFGLTAFQSNFKKIDSFVEFLLEDITTVERKAMAYMALVHIYTPVGLPGQFFKNLLNSPGNEFVNLRRYLDPRRMSLTVYDIEQEAWRISHFIIAQEIRNRIIGGNNRDWKQHITSWALEFIEYCARLRLSEDGHSEFVIDVMYHMFVSREQTTDLEPQQFSRLISDIPDEDEALGQQASLAVLEKLCTAFENQPHFLAHYARRLSYADYHDRAIEQAQKAVDNAERLSMNDYKLQHILGSVLSLALYKIIVSTDVAFAKPVKW